MSQQIAIIGDGAMAIVCSQILADAGCRVRLYSAFEDNAAVMVETGEHKRYLPGAKLPRSLEITTDPEVALEGVELIISAVPTQFVRWWWRGLAPHCPEGVAICSATKGIEEGTLLRPTQVIAEVLGITGDRHLTVLSGPNIAHEVARELPATSVVACGEERLAKELQGLFSRPYFRVYTSSDVVGVEIAAATKNIIAIAAGILDGIGAGDNAKAALLTRGLVEITRLGVAVGGQRETFAGLAGLGDLVTTCISPHGRNRSFGEAVGGGGRPEDVLAGTESVVEGVATTRSVLALAARCGVEMPIAKAVESVLFEGKLPKEAITELMLRRLKGEKEAD